MTDRSDRINVQIMSALYLVLRSRLDSVREWVLIDAAVLKAAREAKGLSYETVARELHVAAKTWERYEKAGRVPRALLAQVAELLGLEIEEPSPKRVTIEPLELRVKALAELRSHLDQRFDTIESMLTELAPREEVDPLAAARAGADAARKEAEEAAAAQLQARARSARRGRESG